MPNTGKPSRDCHLCRQRRVKCDLGRPGCQRCVKYGVECPGYRNEQDVVFRHEGPFSIDKGKQKKAAARTRKQVPSNHSSGAATPASATAGDGPVSRDGDEADGQTIVTSRGPTPSHTHFTVSFNQSPALELKESWTSHSIPLLLHCYSSVRFLSELYQRVRAEDDPLVLATHLWCRAYMSNRFCAPHDRRETTLCLGNTLRSVATAIQDPTQGTADSTVMAVWLLGMYELQIGGMSNHTVAPSAWHVHSNGLLSLIRARGLDQFLTANGRHVFWSAYTVVQVSCIISSRECPPESEEWLGTIEPLAEPHESQMVHISRYICRACRLLSIVTPICVSRLFQEAKSKYIDLTKEVDLIEQAMMDWMSRASRDEMLVGPITQYFWNTFRATRLKLHHAVLLFSNLVEHSPEPSPVNVSALERRRQICSETIETAAKAIVDDVPVSLGGKSSEFSTDPHGAWFEGIRHMGPLATVFTIRTVPKHLRITAKWALISIGKERGILQALKSRPGATNYAPEAMVGVPIDEAVESFDLSEQKT